jgi:hypothetical protein
VGIGLRRWKNLVCVGLVAILPESLVAEDSASAILHSTGRVLLNGNPAPVSSALFPDDFVQVQANSQAIINATGSTVVVGPDTVIQVESNELALDHGTLSVSTSGQFRVRVGCITVIPVSELWTQYDVTDVDGRVTVSAHTKDVDINARGSRVSQKQEKGSNERVTVREGEQKTRDEHCGAATKPPKYVAGKGAIFNSPKVRWPAAGVIIGGMCWVLCRSDDPVSPWVP